MKTGINNLFVDRYFENRLFNDKKRLASFDTYTEFLDHRLREVDTEVTTEGRHSTIIEIVGLKTLGYLM